MKSKSIKDTLYHVAEDVLEKIAFIFSFPEDDRDNLDYSGAVAAKVSFSGLFNGSVILAVSNQVLKMLTGNMLGLDDDEETLPDQQHDALKELINVICGNLLPAVAGRQIVFNVDTPKIISENEDIIEDGVEPLGIARLSIEDEGQCDILFFVDGGLPESITKAEE